MSDTPLTDAFYEKLYDSRIPASMIEAVSGEERKHAKSLERRISEAQEKIERVERERDELQQTFDLRWKADMRAIKQWHEVTGRKQTWPDHTDLCVFLLMALDISGQRADAAESRCAELREALWVCAEHNELHFGANHNTVIQARAALTKEAKHG